MNMDVETKQALLLAPNDENCQQDSPRDTRRYEEARSWKSCLRHFAAVQVVLLLLYTAMFSLILRNSPLDMSGSEFVYTPAEPVNKFEKTMLNMHLYKDNPYKGPPSAAVEDAWSKLFTNAYIRLSGDELKRLGRNSTLIPDGSGDYMGALGGQITPLERVIPTRLKYYIFKYVHQDYYTLRKINVPAKDHINHCIDVLRQVVMCLGDTSISTLSFYESYPRTWPEFRFEHSCRNWEAVDSWAGQPGRAVDQSDPDLLEQYLQNPDYVPSKHEFDGHGEEYSD